MPVIPRIMLELPEAALLEKDVDAITKAIHVAFFNAKITVNRVLTDDNAADPEKRLMWALEFASQWYFRINQRGEMHEHVPGVPGRYDFGLKEHYLRGSAIKNFPLDLY